MRKNTGRLGLMMDQQIFENEGVVKSSGAEKLNTIRTKKYIHCI